jgi:toxin ParE1/3/4
MSGYIISSPADEDLQDIYDYSENNWGEKQAAKYLRELYVIFELLATNPNIGRRRSELGSDIFSISHAAHIVYFMLWNSEMAIVRVLHASRDAEAAFDTFDPSISFAQ